MTNKIDLSKYRIRRTDSRNVVIQKLIGDPEKRNWVTKSYHGNSHLSLVSGLFELIMAQHTPEAEKLFEAIKKVELELVSGLAEIEKLVKDYER